jgi:hypothetical protein
MGSLIVLLTSPIGKNNCPRNAAENSEAVTWKNTCLDFDVFSDKLQAPSPASRGASCKRKLLSSHPY